MKSKVKLKEMNCYTQITEIEGVFEIEQEDKYIATVYALGQWDDNGSRQMSVRNFADYETLYEEEHGIEHQNTGDLSSESIDKLWEMLEEEL
jgi:hypothetical protein